MEEDKMIPQIQQKKKACVERTSESSAEQLASAERNRDALTLMSKEDRNRLAGQYGVIVRVGKAKGKVIGSGPTMDEAVQSVQNHPDYRPMECSVRYITSAEDHPLSNICNSKP